MQTTQITLTRSPRSLTQTEKIALWQFFFDKCPCLTSGLVRATRSNMLTSFSFYINCVMRKYTRDFSIRWVHSRLVARCLPLARAHPRDKYYAINRKRAVDEAALGYRKYTLPLKPNTSGKGRRPAFFSSLSFRLSVPSSSFFASFELRFSVVLSCASPFCLWN